MDGSKGVQARTDDDVRRLKELAGRRQLPDRAGRLDALLGELDGALDDLQVILGPVLRPQGPALVEESGPESSTELAALLSSVSARLQRAVVFARDLADRVDL